MTTVEVGPVGGTGPTLTLSRTAVSADLEVECGCVVGYHHAPACTDGLTGRVEPPGLGPLPAWAQRPEPAAVVSMRTLTCAQCERTWQRPQQPGSPSEVCPSCQAAVPAAA